MKVKKYKVMLFASLPCSASIEVEATSEEEAKEKADKNWRDADWDGPDYNTPDGHTVEIGDVERIS